MGDAPMKAPGTPAIRAAVPYTVKGQVREVDGTPISGATVQAFDQDLRSLNPLGQQTTGADGSYQVRYELAQLKRPGKTAADLVIKATAAGGTVIGQSATLFHAPPDAQVDVTRGNQPYLGPAEVSSLSTAIAPIIGTVKAGDLTESDISYVAGDSGLPADQVRSFVGASAVGATSSVDPHFIYGLARNGFSATLDRLLATDPQAQIDILQAAANRNIIPPSLAQSIPQAVAQLQQTAVSRTLAPGATRLAGTLSVAIGDVKLQTSFLNTFLANRSDSAAFWKALANQPGFTPAIVSSAQFTTQLGALTQYHTPLVQALTAQQQQGKIRSLADLAGMESSDWLLLLNSKTSSGAVIGVPTGVPGANAAEMTQNYAEALSRRLEAAFPTVAVSARLAKSKLPSAGAVSAFLNAHPDFDIGGANAVTYAAAHGAPAEVIQQLPAIQRVFKVAPRFDQMEPLLAAGLNSARAIAALPLEHFIATFGSALGGSDEAIRIYSRAQLFTHSAVHLFGQFASTLGGNDPRVLEFDLQSSPEIPNWTSLFGSADFCACSDCQSVLSPAAYLVDLLNQFLDPFIADNKGHTGTSLLFARRPDINTLQLSCENTNTVLPYIDLVNELLEDAVSPGTAVAHDTTEGQSPDLGAAPEYLNAGAYTTLSAQVFPWGLPFDLALAQARTYLSQLKLDRADLIQALMGSPAAADPDDAALTNADALAAESLGLSSLAWKILTGVSGHQPWELWGLSQADWLNVWTKSAPGPTVQQFLTQTGIGFEDLVDLLTTRFAQGLAASPNNVQIQWADNGGESCDLTKATVLNLSPAVLDGFLRFLRLRNALNATVLDTDKLVYALKTAAFDPDFIRRVSIAAQLQASTGLPWTELASWWGNIPTLPDEFGGTSLYQRLFLNPAITNPLDTAFGLTPDGTELADTSHFLEDAAHQPTVLAGLQVAAADLALLLASLPLDKSGAQHILNLGNLSQLFHTVSLSRALGLSVADFLAFSSIAALNVNPVSGGTPPPAPFDRTRPGDAFWTLNQIQFIQGSAFSIADLGYLLLDTNASSSTLAPAVSDLTQQLNGLMAGLQPILASTGGGASWTAQGGAFVAQQLSGWLPLPNPVLAGSPTSVPPAPAWLDSTPAGFPASYRTTLLDANFVGAAAPVTDSAVSAALAAPVPANPALAPPLYYQVRALIKLKKLATLGARLKLQTPELYWLNANAAPLGWLDLNALPAFGAAPPPLYSGWVSLTVMAQLRTQYAPAQPFTNFMPPRPPAPAPAIGAYLGTLSALTSWNVSDLTTLFGATGFNLSYPGDLWKPATFTRIQSAAAVLSKLGASAAQLLPWTHAVVTPQQANDITTLIKGHYSVADWPAKGKALRDPLRQQQRDALSAYLIYQSPSLFQQQFTSVDDLFGYFLIDTQMGSCMQTSRIIQATQSVQTFITRAFLNLEPSVTVDPKASQYWTWMKQYRLWEANREVFLYPENWLDPTLRDDQTSFFTTMAAALRQGAISQDTVETAYLNYLTSLDGVARLAVCGMYHDLDPASGIDTVYVFARTQSAPCTYYLRQFVNSSSWTEWEKVDLDIPGCDVIPVIYNRRLYVFWPVMKTISVAPNNMSVPNPGQSDYSPSNTPKWVQISVAWSQYAQGKWVAKRVSDPPGLLIPVWPQLSESSLVPSESEAYFPTPSGIWPQAVRPDGSVDASYFTFKAVPPAEGSSLDQMQIHCYIVN